MMMKKLRQSLCVCSEEHSPSFSQTLLMVEGVCKQGAEKKLDPKRQEVIGGWKKLFNKELIK